MSTTKSYQQEVDKVPTKAKSWASWPSKVVVDDTATDTKESIATDIKCDDRMNKLGVAFWSSWSKMPAGFTP